MDIQAVNNAPNQVTTPPPSNSKPQEAAVSGSSPQPQAQKPKTDTVQISSAAQKMLQEATETPAQTLKEANSGDTQAKKLLAKEAAQENGE